MKKNNSDKKVNNINKLSINNRDFHYNLLIKKENDEKDFINNKPIIQNNIFLNLNSLNKKDNNNMDKHFENSPKDIKKRFYRKKFI